MFNFDLEKAAIFQAIKKEKEPIFRWANLFKKIFLGLFIIFFSAFIYRKLIGGFSQKNQNIFLGFSIIFLTLAIFFLTLEAFFDSKLKKPKLKTKIENVLKSPEEYNLAEFLSFEAAKGAWKSIQFAKSKKLPEISSSILFYYLILDNPKLNFILSRALLNANDIKDIIKAHLSLSTKAFSGKKFSLIFSDDFQKTIIESFDIADKKNHLRVELEDVFYALSKQDLIFKKILIDSNLKVEDIENLTWWLEDLEKTIEQRKKFWEWKNLIKRGSLAKEWSAGYTLTLDRFSIDLSEMVKRQGFPEIIGHQQEIETMERILARNEACNDPLIVGEAGSGRKSMILALAKKSVLGESLPELNYKRIVQLELPALLAQAETPDETEMALDVIFREVLSAGNVILAIDEFHNFVGSGKTAKPGAIDISGVLSSYISSPYFRLIGITTFEGLHKNIEQNPSLLDFFEKVEVSEISHQETLKLLEKLALKLEAKFKKMISYPALRDIITLCEKYIQTVPFPEKAMDLLEEAMVNLAQSKEKIQILLPKHIAKILSDKLQVPIGEVESKEREILLNLENLFHQKIVNQEEAIREVSSALRRARAEITIRKGPIGTFLFLGPTGVGKTETAKALAEIYFGSEDRMIRLDMSEFQDVKDIPRLIGSPGEEGLLTTPVRENPFSLILLDELEKAHPNILNLFLQVLDEGYLTDGLGRKIDFKNSIIIATSNAGYQIILKALKINKLMSEIKEELLDFLFKEGVFRPEFLNRFDAVIVFKSLTKENLLDIAELLLQSLKKNLKEKEIEFVITLELKQKVVELGYDPTFGAREMRRIIQDKIENPLAQAILSNKLKRGSKVEINPENFSLKINF